ncbi:16S rRNA (guanine(966)-N(2))-methyltransferase RsmD [Candidatus Endobugula sertula]|uniref:Ribosomal RNA small subunit methyltransferase D n=1 Tax=Candidatus Endobugula sertula TaxID=62101 RepID=A0A1D2QTD0_9GAMM|nr:16S rRNA (guanine(966)-N(2))-methyltransferase RsmD [Candidatus Endobugula sertula]
MAKNRQRSSSQANQLRIIGGRWRGKKLPIADIEGLRPTGDRIRETLFNWLMPVLPGSRCLDLFAGSGALGLECLSRGATEVLLLEKHPQAAAQLQQHCTLLNANNGKVIQTDSLSWLNGATLPEYSMDIVFIDPPFANNLWQSTIDALEFSRCLKTDAMIYIETPHKTTIRPPEHWQLHREKQAGNICYRLYQYWVGES